MMRKEKTFALSLLFPFFLCLPLASVPNDVFVRRKHILTGITFLTAGKYKYGPYEASNFAAGVMENKQTTVLTTDRAMPGEVTEDCCGTFIFKAEALNNTYRLKKDADVSMHIQPNAGTQMHIGSFCPKAVSNPNRYQYQFQHYLYVTPVTNKIKSGPSSQIGQKA
jgi:hypothetical protein